MTLEEALLQPVLQLHGGISSATAILNSSAGGLLLDQLSPSISSTSWPGAYYEFDGFNGTGNASLLDDSDSQNSNKFILPWWRQIIWTVLFAGMIVVATGGNLIVIWIVLAHKRMRTVTNYFLVNLSIADAMVSTLNVIFNYTYMLNSHWPFGNLYCKISQFIAVITICASVFTLMAISIDR